MHRIGDSYRTKVPYWLVTITIPSLTLRFAYPEPLNGPVEVDDGGDTLRFFPGLLGDEISITHSILGTLPSVSLEFRLPPEVTAYPAQLDWAAGRVDVCHWFEGDTWAERRMLFSDRVTTAEVGGRSEPIRVTAQVNSEDQGKILSPDTVIDSTTWSDVGDDLVSSASTLAFDENQIKRAYQSAGEYYGEIIGYPTWAQGWVVKDQVRANSATSPVVEFEPFHIMVCDGTLHTTGVIRNYLYRCTNRSNPTIIFGISDTAQIFTESDGNNRTTTLCTPRPVRVQGAETIVSTTRPRVYPASTDAYTLEGLEFVDTDIAAGDMIRFSASAAQPDAEAYWRVCYKIDSGSPRNDDYYGIGILDREYADSATAFPPPYDVLTSEQSGDLQILPLIRDAGGCFIACDVYGGRSSLTTGDVLRDANDVIYTYMLRSVGVEVDLSAIRGLEEVSAYKIDGQITDGSLSPLEWVTQNILPLLPMVVGWTGTGLTFLHIDPNDTIYVADLDVGRSGLDGDRISTRPIQDATSVINDVTIRYNWQAHKRSFANTVYTMPAGVDPQTQLSNRVLSGKARLSQERWGKRSLTLETLWTSDEVTAKRAVAQLLDRYHKPRWRLVYQLKPEWGGLELNDIIRITDADMGISNTLVRIVEITHGRLGPTVTVEEMG